MLVDKQNKDSTISFIQDSISTPHVNPSPQPPIMINFVLHHLFWTGILLDCEIEEKQI